MTDVDETLLFCLMSFVIVKVWGGKGSFTVTFYISFTQSHITS